MGWRDVLKDLAGGTLVGNIPGVGDKIDEGIDWLGDTIEGKVDFQARPYDVQEDEFIMPHGADRQGQMLADAARVGGRSVPQIGRTVIGGSPGTGPGQTVPQPTMSMGAKPVVGSIERPIGGPMAPEPTPGKSKVGLSEDVRSRQLGLAKLIGDRTSGTAGTSVAAMRSAQAREQLMGQAAQAQATGDRMGASQGLAYGGQQIAAQAAAQGRAETAAEAQVANMVSAGARQQDISEALHASNIAQQKQITKIGLGNERAMRQSVMDGEVSLANLNAALRSQGMNDQQIAYYMGNVIGISLEQMKANIERDRQLFTAWAAPKQLQAGIARDRAAGQSAMIGGLVGAGAGMLGTFFKPGQPVGTGQTQAYTRPDQYAYTPPPPGMPYQPGQPGSLFSDERTKDEIEDKSAAIDSTLSELGTSSYVYKDKRHGEGRYVSPMAQELERSPLTRDMVFQGPDGHKMVDYSRATGFIMSAQARLNQRLDELADVIKKQNKRKGKS